MLINLFGMHGTYQVEQKVGDNLRLQFKSVLGGLKTRRDKLAHSQLKGQTAHLLGLSSSAILMKDVPEPIFCPAHGNYFYLL